MRTKLGEAFVDEAGRLVSADEPLASLQIACGGSIPGALAIPELAAAVRKARAYKLRLVRRFQALSSDHRITAWVHLEPLSAFDDDDDSPREEGCLVHLLAWRTEPLQGDSADHDPSRQRAIERSLAELTARLDVSQNLISYEADAEDLNKVSRLMEDGLGQRWTNFVTFDDRFAPQAMHWRMLDGATCKLAGSSRTWRVQLEPLGAGGDGSRGFSLYLTAAEPLGAINQPADDEAPAPASIGSDLVPVLRAPVARIIENAETIQRKLAGPLAEDYSTFASDIAVAGRHLLSLMDDLAELEQVEASTFAPLLERIDLGDIARRAVQVLGAEARAKRVQIVAPPEGERLLVEGDERRTLQVVLNLLANALKYGPEQSQVWLRLDRDHVQGGITVADMGHGLSQIDQAKAFEKFERLGRTDSSGTGLGLHISRRIAEAMDGSLTVESAPGQGARFTLRLPLAR